MRQHADLGYNFVITDISLRKDQYFKPIKYHHIWWRNLVNNKDLSSEEKFLTGFLSVIDAIDAITAERPYNPQVFSVAEAISLMEADEGRYNSAILDSIKENAVQIQERVDIVHRDNKTIWPFNN